MSDAAKYRQWFWSEHSKCVLEPDVREFGPSVPNLPPGVKSWRIEWFILFPDNHYIRVCENWRPSKKAGEPERFNFSFHYGETPAINDHRGAPRWHPSEPVTIRIDKDHVNGVHMHYDGRDHIPEDKIKGCDIRALPLFEFVKSVLEHRRSNKSFEEILGFRI